MVRWEWRNSNSIIRPPHPPVDVTHLYQLRRQKILPPIINGGGLQTIALFSESFVGMQYQRGVGVGGHGQISSPVGKSSYGQIIAVIRAAKYLPSNRAAGAHIMARNAGFLQADPSQRS